MYLGLGGHQQRPTALREQMEYIDLEHSDYIVVGWLVDSVDSYSDCSCSCIYYFRQRNKAHTLAKQTCTHTRITQIITYSRPHSI